MKLKITACSCGALASQEPWTMATCSHEALASCTPTLKGRDYRGGNIGDTKGAQLREPHVAAGL
jgi:hypothetical protein